jgi:Leucine-rich repeat (LRR) protein
MSPVAVLPNLEELYLAQNKLRKISGIQEMRHLRILDLGANRIRVSSHRSHHSLPLLSLSLSLTDHGSGDGTIVRLNQLKKPLAWQEQNRTN